MIGIAEMFSELDGYARCEDALEVWRAIRSSRRRRATRSRPAPAHGTTNMYNKHACRCGLCRKAHADKKREYDRRRRAVDPVFRETRRRYGREGMRRMRARAKAATQ